MNNIGCEIHDCIQLDPLDLGCIRLETGEWAHPCDEFAKKRPPRVGERVFSIQEDGVTYWIGSVNDVINRYP